MATGDGLLDGDGVDDDPLIPLRDQPPYLVFAFVGIVIATVVVILLITWRKRK